MPIVLAQPEPMMPGVSAGYGALEQYQRDRQFALQQAQVQNQIEQSQRHQQLQEAQFFAGQEPSQRDLWLGQQQQQAQEQRVKLHADLQQMELTQKEEMRLQQMKSAIADVQADTSLSQEEKDDFSLQLKTGIDPLQQRKARSAIAHQEQQDQLLEEQAAKQSQITAKHAAFQAKSLPERIVKVQHPDTGESVYMFEESPGHWGTWPPKGKGAGAGEGAAKGQMTEAQWSQAYGSVVKEVDARLKAEAMARAKAKDEGDAGAVGGAINAAQGTTRESMIDDALRRRGLATTLQEHQSRGGKPAGGQPSPDRPQMPQADQEAAGRPQMEVPRVPFDPRSGKKLTAEQSAIVGDFVKVRREIADRITDPAQKQKYQGAIDELQSLYQSAGSTAAMTPEEKQRAAELIGVIRSAPDQAWRKDEAGQERVELRPKQAENAKYYAGNFLPALSVPKLKDELERTRESIRETRKRLLQEYEGRSPPRDQAQNLEELIRRGEAALAELEKRK